LIALKNVIDQRAQKRAAQAAASPAITNADSVASTAS